MEDEIMYSWGDDTNTWRNRGAYDYGSARSGYLDKLAKTSASRGSRSYERPAQPNLGLVSPLKKIIKSESENPVIVAVDCTGSMQHWPAEIFDRLPLLYQTLSKYKPDVEISFSVIGDGFTDQWPLQVADFGKDVALEDKLKALYPEGGGGGNHKESYELWAHFMNEHVETPNAKTPFMIVMGDEGFYEKISRGMVKHYVGDILESDIDALDVWKKLKGKFNIYLLHKKYTTDDLDKEVVMQWSHAIGKERILSVAEPERVVDIAMGIIARQWGNFDDFTKNLSARQDSKSISKVMDSLRIDRGGR